MAFRSRVLRVISIQMTILIIALPVIFESKWTKVNEAVDSEYICICISLFVCKAPSQPVMYVVMKL